MKLTFYGAAQNVTGSKHLIESGTFRLLLDCGLYQGHRKESDQANRNLPFDAASIDAAIISHAHADHCGMLPVLVKNGFQGKIYSTTATADIMRYILEDSAKIQEQDAIYYNDNLGPGENPIYPLYTDEDVQQTLQFIEAVPYFRVTQQWTVLTDNIRCKLYDAGHILGSAVIVVEIKEDGQTKTLAFSGDLGRVEAPLLPAPEAISEPVDTLLLECTYGNRHHQSIAETTAELRKIITEAISNRRKIIVPAFSLGRTQELLYLLHKLSNEKAIPSLPIYLDSPLAERLVEVFAKHPEDYDQETWQDFTKNKELPLAFANLTLVKSVAESKQLNQLPGPFMVISASGMAEGGRILHHLMHNIEDPNAFILITGFQGANTLGRKIQEGISPVRIFGRLYDVRAKVITLDGLSAHADQSGLLEYIDKLAPHLKHLYLVHTEPPQALAFKKLLSSQYPKLPVTIPRLGQSFEL